MAKKVRPLLVDHVGVLVESVEFSLDEANRLRQALDARIAPDQVSAVLESLRQCCELGRMFWHLQNDDPTQGQVRAALLEIKSHAVALAEAISRADSITDSILAEVAFFDMGDWRHRDSLPVLLDGLACGVDKQLRSDGVSFAAARTPWGQIKLIDEALIRHNVKIKPSKSAGRFYTIAQVCLEKIGYYHDPEYPISVYAKSINGEASKKNTAKKGGNAPRKG